MKDDAAVVKAVLAGRTELFAELVDRHAAAVFRVVRSGVHQAADAEDLAQEIFLAGFKSLSRLREPARFRSYLLGIAARQVAGHLRRGYRKGQLLPLEEEPPAPPPRDVGSRIAAVEAVVERLPPDARLVFSLRHHEGWSCKRIAKLLEVPDGTVYSRLSRIHARIRAAVEVGDR